MAAIGMKLACLNSIEKTPEEKLGAMGSGQKNQMRLIAPSTARVPPKRGLGRLNAARGGPVHEKSRKTGISFRRLRERALTQP